VEEKAIIRGTIQEGHGLTDPVRNAKTTKDVKMRDNEMGRGRGGKYKKKGEYP